MDEGGGVHGLWFMVYGVKNQELETVNVSRSARPSSFPRTRPNSPNRTRSRPRPRHRFLNVAFQRAR
jgi:hypothetical protein